MLCEARLLRAEVLPAPPLPGRRRHRALGPRGTRPPAPRHAPPPRPPPGAPRQRRDLRAARPRSSSCSSAAAPPPPAAPRRRRAAPAARPAAPPPPPRARHLLHVLAQQRDARRRRLALRLGLVRLERLDHRLDGRVPHPPARAPRPRAAPPRPARRWPRRACQQQFRRLVERVQRRLLGRLRRLARLLARLLDAAAFSACSASSLSNCCDSCLKASSVAPTLRLVEACTAIWCALFAALRPPRRPLLRLRRDARHPLRWHASGWRAPRGSRRRRGAPGRPLASASAAACSYERSPLIRCLISYRRYFRPAAAPRAVAAAPRLRLGARSPQSGAPPPPPPR